MADPRTPESAAQVYDDLGQVYEDAFGHQPAVGTALDHLLTLLPVRARVLDLGSGTGSPVAVTVAAAGHDVTGYDVSEKMVGLARTRVPGARFERADMLTLDFSDGSWDAVLSFFSMLQLPLCDQAAMLTRLARWLAPGGYFVLATVPSDKDGRMGEWMGHWVQTFSYGLPALRQCIESSGLRIVREDLVDFVPASDKADPEPQVYLTARKQI